MRRWFVLGLGLMNACSGDDSSTSGAASGGDSGTTGAVATGGDDDGDGANTMATDGTVDESDADTGVGSGEETEGPGDPTLCWQVDELGEVAGESEGRRMYDADGDGSQELWVWEIAVDLASTDLHRLSVDGQEVDTLAGAFVALSDVDGDGTHDAIMQDEPGVFALYLGERSGFAEDPMPVTYPGGEIVGAFDLDGDGNGDLLLRGSDVALVAALGDGTGAFVSASSLGVPSQTTMDATPMWGDPSWFALRSRPSPDNKACNENRIDLVRFDGGELASSATGPMDSWEVPVGVVDVSGEGNPDVFVVACDTIPSITNLRLLTDDGSGGVVDSVVVSNAQWAVAADVDDDGAVDVVWGDEVEGEMLVRLDATTPDGTESTDVGAATVEHNAVLAGEMDGRGAQEVIRGVVAGDNTRYERVYTVPCD